MAQRGDLYLASKFTHQGDQHREDGSCPYEFDVPLAVQVEQSVDSTLKKLGTDYVDALLLHGQMGSCVSPTLPPLLRCKRFVGLSVCSIIPRPPRKAA